MKRVNAAAWQKFDDLVRDLAAEKVQRDSDNRVFAWAIATTLGVTAARSILPAVLLGGLPGTTVIGAASMAAREEATHETVRLDRARRLFDELVAIRDGTDRSQRDAAVVELERLFDDLIEGRAILL